MEKTRPKMPRAERAKQFAPFDALKGLSSALFVKEYENERVQRGEIQEEKANEISKFLINLEKGEVVRALYFRDGHYFESVGACKLFFEDGYMLVGREKIFLNELFDITK